MLHGRFLGEAQGDVSEALVSTSAVASGIQRTGVTLGWGRFVPMKRPHMAQYLVALPRTVDAPLVA